MSPIIEKVSGFFEAVDEAITTGFGTKNSIEVQKETPTEVANTNIEDGVEVVTKDGSGTGNAPNGKGAIVEEGKSAVGVEEPSELSRMQNTLGKVVEFVTNLTKTTYEVTGSELVIGAKGDTLNADKLSPGGGFINI